jgi:hypothetical protein
LLAVGAVAVAGSAVVLEAGIEVIWLGGTLLVTVVGLVWLDQTTEDTPQDTPPGPATDGQGLETDGAADADDQAVDGDDSETVSATDGGEATETTATAITKGTAVLVGIASVALCSTAVFVTTTLTAASWPAGWIAEAGISIPTVANQVLVLGLVAGMIGGILYLTEELLERDQPKLTVRVMGGLLGLASVILVGATIVFALRGVFSGIPIPLGMLVFVPLAYILLTVDLA